ncbi:unnamed protein product [Rhizophagus irregularis]|nr:unnamed protein product [Rhizophagus irregularis]
MVDNENQQYYIEHDNFTTFNDKSRLNITTKNDDKKKVPPGFENIVRRKINVLYNRRLSWDTTKDKIVNGPSRFLDENRRIVRKEIKQKNKKTINSYYELFNNNNLLRVEEMYNDERKKFLPDFTFEDLFDYNIENIPIIMIEGYAYENNYTHITTEYNFFLPKQFKKEREGHKLIREIFYKEEKKWFKNLWKKAVPFLYCD